MKCLKINTANYIKICRAMFEATNLPYWLEKPIFDKQIGLNFLKEFHLVNKELQSFVKNGGIFKYNLINFSTAKKIPFIYNSL